MILRDYENNDAFEILKWIDNERELRLWSADRYGAYPITAEDINSNYDTCKKEIPFYAYTLIDDEENVVGHISVRFVTNNEARLGFIIVSKNIRGKGYGKILIKEAIKKCKELKADKITLGVFTTNESALYAYRASGFVDCRLQKEVYKFHDESWDILEMVLKEEEI